METALQASLKIDVRRERARQYAAMLIHELSRAGYIADQCIRDAEACLANLFHQNDVEMTTAGQRHVAALATEQIAAGGEKCE